MDNEKTLQIISILEAKDYEAIQTKLSDFNYQASSIKNEIQKLQDKLDEINQEEKKFKIAIFNSLLDKAEDFYIPPF